MNCFDWFEPIAVPFGWLMMRLYEFFYSYGLALFLIAVFVKVVLLPFQMKSKRGMMRQTRLQPRIAELQKKHAANKQKLNEEMAKLYKEEGVNPAAGCLWSFIQMPIMIALFIAIRQPLTLMMGLSESLFNRVDGVTGRILEVLESAGVTTYTNEVLTTDWYVQINIAHDVSRFWEYFERLIPPIEGLANIDFNLFGIIDLTKIPNWQFLWNPGDGIDTFNLWMPGFLLFLLPILSGAAQFVSAGIMRKMNAAGSPEAAGGSAGKIIKFMPLMSVWFGFILPAALSFYWMIGTILQIAQDIWLTKKYTKILDEEDAEKAKVRAAREAELEAKRLETERRKAEGLAERNRNTSKNKKRKSNRQDQIDKAAEWEKKNTPVSAKTEEKDEPGRVGNRRYARGRAYDPERFSKEAEDSAVKLLGTADDDIEDEQDGDDIDERADIEIGYEEDSFDETENDEGGDIDDGVVDDDYDDDGEEEYDEDEDDSDVDDEDGEDDDDYGDEDGEDEDDDDGGDDDDEDGEDEDDDGEDGDDDGEDGEENENSSTSSTVRFDTKRFDSKD